MNIDKLKKTLMKKYDVSDSYDIAFIMGSGLDGGVEIENKIVVPYDKIGMPKSKVQGFKGEFTFGNLFDKKVMKITRYHYYESGDRNLVRLPFEILEKFNVKVVVMATSVGGVNAKLNAGDLMLITDHINLVGNNPLIGADKIEFIDMNNTYDKDFRKMAVQIAKNNDIQLFEGVHTQLSGPTYETPAEVAYLDKMGAYTVSMSTVFDAICARAKGMKVLAFASVVNKAGDTENQITHEEVLRMSKINASRLKVLVENFVKDLKI